MIFSRMDFLKMKRNTTGAAGAVQQFQVKGNYKVQLSLGLSLRKGEGKLYSWCSAGVHYVTSKHH